MLSLTAHADGRFGMMSAVTHRTESRQLGQRAKKLARRKERRRKQAAVRGLRARCYSAPRCSGVWGSKVQVQRDRWRRTIVETTSLRRPRTDLRSKHGIIAASLVAGG